MPAIVLGTGDKSKTNTDKSSFLRGAYIQGVFSLSLNIFQGVCTFVALLTWIIFSPHGWLFIFRAYVPMLPLREPFLF